MDDDRALEMLLGEVALVLGLQVLAPLDGEGEVPARGLEDGDGLGVGHALEGAF